MIKVNTVGEVCPAPLVKFRRALKKAEPGEEIEIVGDHPESKAEIILATLESGHDLVNVVEEGKKWRIIVRKRG